MKLWRVGVWCAVSSKPQADPEKESLPAQEQAGREFARAIGGEVARVYVVPGHSRDYVFWTDAEKDMPAYQMVREDLAAGKLDVVHCIDSDRLGRDAALIQQFYSLAEKYGAEVYDASMPHPLGQQHTGHRYGIAVKGVAADEDQRRRIQRHGAGVRARVRRGLPALSRWPLGYTEIRTPQGKCIGGEFNDDIGAVELITSLFLQGCSYQTILEELWSSGYRLPNGRPFYLSGVWRIIHSDVYAGFVHWGGARNSEPSLHFPALWDGPTYAAILRQRENRGGSWLRPEGGPLQGIVYCGRCAHRMGRFPTKHPGEWYLRCNTHADRARVADHSGCHPNYILESVITAALSEWLAQFSTPELLDEVLSEDAGLGALEDERARLQARIDDLEQRRRRLALALAAGAMELGIYSETDRELQAQGAQCQGRLNELHALIRSRPDPAERRRHLETLIVSRLENLADPATSAALRRAGVRVYCENRHVTLIGLAT